jgi:hypothetical protein
MSNAEISYNTIMGPNDSVTGVRGTDTTNSGNVVLTGSQIIGGAPQTLLWEGNLYTGVGTSYNIIPNVSGTVTTSNFYGPDTRAFNPSIPEGQIRAVGTYQTTASPGITHGFLYQGPLTSGTQAVTLIDVEGATNTIPHSTAGDIAVGAYDDGSPSSGNAFIYNITDDSYVTLNIGTGASLYGVWHVGGDNYVIAGGARNPNEGNASQAFLANYDASTQTLSDETFYTFLGIDGVYNHFEGVTAVEGGYSLIATVTGPTGDQMPIGSALAFVAVDNEGVFASTAEWVPLNFPDATITTGNTVYWNVGMGVYETSEGGGTHSYTAAVPEPGTNALIGAGLFLMTLTGFGRKRPSKLEVAG